MLSFILQQIYHHQTVLLKFILNYHVFPKLLLFCGKQSRNVLIKEENLTRAGKSVTVKPEGRYVCTISRFLPRSNFAGTPANLRMCLWLCKYVNVYVCTCVCPYYAYMYREVLG